MLRYLARVMFRFFLIIVLQFVLLATLPGIPPWTTFSEYSVLPPLPRTGALAPNNILDGAKRLFEGKIVGPESIAWRKTDEVFIGTSDGAINRIYGDHFNQISKVVQLGHPLGMRFSPNGRLLVADCVNGIYSVDVDTGDNELLVSPDDLIDGKPFRFPDDVDTDDEGNIYWSDASTIAGFHDGLLEFLSDPTGRLVRYDPQTKTNTVLMDKIHFANGIQLSPSKHFILVSETRRSRVHRYWLKGSQKGQRDIFVDQLPGFPDNIRPRPSGGYYISLALPRHADNPNNMDELLNGNALFRKILCRILACIQIICNTLNTLIPFSFFDDISQKIFSFHMVPEKPDNVTIIVEVDEDGNIIGSLQGSTGNLFAISETTHVGHNIFFGSPWANFLGHLYVGGDKKIKSHVEKVDNSEHTNENDKVNEEIIMDRKDEL